MTHIKLILPQRLAVSRSGTLTRTLRCACLASLLSSARLKNGIVQRAAESLYSHIDNLELYPGLQAEEAKQPGPGAGLVPGYTISRSILAGWLRVLDCRNI